MVMSLLPTLLVSLMDSIAVVVAVGIVEFIGKLIVEIVRLDRHVSLLYWT